MLPNKGMKLSERASLGGEYPVRACVMESRSAAYAQCWADLVDDLRRLIERHSL
jgi:hypothetical protein